MSPGLIGIVNSIERTHQENRRLLEMAGNKSYSFRELCSLIIASGRANAVSGIPKTYLYILGINPAVAELDSERFISVEQVEEGSKKKYKLAGRAYLEDDILQVGSVD